MTTGDYTKMWDDFAVKGAKKYLGTKYTADNIVGLTGLAREHEILRHLAVRVGDRVIDVGCASGRQVFRVAPFCRDAVGVDISKNFIDAAKQYAEEYTIKNVQFIVSDGNPFPFGDNLFDRMICSEVIEHVPELHGFIKELNRILKPGARAVWTVPNWNSRGTLYKRLMNGFRPFPFTPITDFSAEAIKAHGDAHVRQFSWPEFAALAREHGFRVMYAGGASFIDFPKSGSVIARTNRARFIQGLTFWIERILARIPLFRSLGRHIVLVVEKN